MIRVLILMLVAFAAGCGVVTRVVVQQETSVVAGLPTPFPSPTPVASVYHGRPTATPFPQEALRLQCDALGGAYYLDQTDNYQVRTLRTGMSPDGRYLAYLERDGVFVRATDGSGAAFKLVDDVPAPPFSIHSSVYWSPDSTKLALMIPRITPRAAEYYWPHDLMIFDFSERLTSTPITVIETTHDSGSSFRGWSPDGGYVVVQREPTDMTIYDAQTGQMTYRQTQPVRVDYLWWSPGDDYAAFITEGQIDDIQNRYGLSLVIVAADGSQEVSHQLPPTNTGYMSPRFVTWSPDLQTVAHYHQTEYAGPFQLDLFMLDGRSRWRVAYGTGVYGDTNLFTASQMVGIHFSPDNDSLLFWEWLSADSWQLVRQPLDGGGQTVVRRASSLPAYPILQTREARVRQGDHFALVEQTSGDGPVITLYDHAGENPIPFVSGAASVAYAEWVPDGSRIVATYAKAERDATGNPIVFMAWMDADGTGYQEIQDARYGAYHDVQWSPDGEWIYAVGERASGQRDVLLVDASDGTIRVMASDVLSAIAPYFEGNRAPDNRIFTVNYAGFNAGYDPLAMVRLGWQEAWDRWRYASIDATGEVVYDLTLDALTLQGVQVVYSPDGSKAALKIRAGYRHERAAVIDVQSGELLSMSRPLIGMGDPTWSPGSELVAYTQAESQGATELAVFNTVTGDSWVGPGWTYNASEWLPCR